MPTLRNYPQALTLQPTDALLIDRVGQGTMYALEGLFAQAAPVVYPIGIPTTGDVTTPLQALFNAAAAAGSVVDCLNMPFNVSTISIPSGTVAQNINFTALPNAADNSPILIDGTAIPASNITLIDVAINGNRVNQTAVLNDGKRQGIAINGRVSNIKIVRPRCWYCATDGIRSDASGVISSSDTDYLQIDVQIIDADLQWNGRWGWSGMSLQNFRFTGFGTNNGKNMPGYPAAPYTSGGNGRNIANALSGTLYAGAFDLEDEGVLGGGFNGVDATVLSLGNSGGVAVTSDVNLATFTGFVTRKNLTLRVTGDNQNAGVGLAPLTVGNNIYSTGVLKTFENVNIEASVRNDPIRLDGIDGLLVNAVGKVGTGTTGSNSAIVTNTTHVVLNIVSDTTANPQIYFPTLPFTAAAAQYFGPTWASLSSPSLSLIGFVPGGGMRVTYAATIVPSATGAVAAALTVTTGSFVSDVTGSFVDQTTGQFLVGGAHTPGTSGVNSAQFGFTATNTDPILVTVSMTVRAP